jgi:hypothetical protein
MCLHRESKYIIHRTSKKSQLAHLTLNPWWVPARHRNSDGLGVMALYVPVLGPPLIVYELYWSL